jgi:hypothetical protein
MSKPTEKTFNLISLFLSAAALLVSCYSLYTSNRTYQDGARVQALKTEYEIFKGLTQAELDYPLLSHLFTITKKAYDSRSVQVAAAASLLSKEDKAKLLLQERAIAHHIFNMYEETYYNWENAKDAGDTARASLLREDLDFFQDQLCNPRLLWYWDPKDRKGEQLSRYFAKRVQNYYKNDTVVDCPLKPDPKGPFSRLVGK